MARQRRGGGFRPPELRGTLGTLLRTALAQTGTLRDALERGAREGRSRLDSALSGRRRQDALAELGDIVLDLIRRGEIDLGELPEVRDIVAHLDEIDSGAVDADDHDEPPPPPSPSSPRGGAARFDTRRSTGSRADTDREDGTVSSRTWARPSPARPAPRVWRPPVDSEETSPGRPPAVAPPARSSSGAPARPSARRTGEEITTPDRPSQRSVPPASSQRKDPARKGGIHFDDDEDLAEYMHPDDVPPKTPPDRDS